MNKQEKGARCQVPGSRQQVSEHSHPTSGLSHQSSEHGFQNLTVMEKRKLIGLAFLLGLLFSNGDLLGQCTQMISDFPAYEGFESLTSSTWSPMGTSTGNDCPDLWTFRNGVDDDKAEKGLYFAEVSSENCTSDKQYILNSPCINFSSNIKAKIKFAQRAKLDYQSMDLELQVSPSGSNTWTTIWNKGIWDHDHWEDEDVSLQAYDGQIIRLRFIVNGTAGSSGYVGIDDIELSADDVDCKWEYNDDGDAYFVCDNVGIGTTAPTAKLDVRGITYIGEIESTNYLEIKSNIRPEVRFTTPTSAGDMRVGVAEGNDASQGISAGDFYVQSTTANSLPLIVGRNGNVSLVNKSGNVGIGTNDPGQYKLAVEGTIGARKVKVTTESWADYVFLPNYDLKPLSYIETYIKEHGHLPNIPAATEVIKNGIDLGAMNVKLMEKIEELTLYLIAQEKRIVELEKRTSDK